MLGIFLAIFALTFSCHAQSLENDIKFEFFYGTAFDPHIITYDLDNIADVTSHVGFRNTGRTAIFHFDEEDYSRQQQVTEIITSYLYTGSYNIIMVIYDDPLLISDENAILIGNVVSQALVRMFATGYDAQLIHFLGKGVGANALSRAGQLLTSQGYLVSRLSALNPTTMVNFAALFADVVISEGYVDGEMPSYGDARFVVNEGVHPQPGCGGQEARCSREFALRIWSESVRSFTAIFPCLRCESWQDFLNGDCNENSIGHMGLHASVFSTGSYMLQTNTRDPWTRDNPFPTEFPPEK